MNPIARGINYSQVLFELRLGREELLDDRPLLLLLRELTDEEDDELYERRRLR